MNQILIEALAAAYLIFIGSTVRTDTVVNGTVFRFGPTSVGILLGAIAYGNFMGWPT